MELAQVVAAERRVANQTLRILQQFRCDVIRARIQEEGDVVDVTDAVLQLALALHLDVDRVIVVNHQTVSCKNIANLIHLSK